MSVKMRRRSREVSRRMRRRRRGGRRITGSKPGSCSEWRLWGIVLSFSNLNDAAWHCGCCNQIKVERQVSWGICLLMLQQLQPRSHETQTLILIVREKRKAWNLGERGSDGVWSRRWLRCARKVAPGFKLAQATSQATYKQPCKQPTSNPTTNLKQP